MRRYKEYLNKGNFFFEITMFGRNNGRSDEIHCNGSIRNSMRIFSLPSTTNIISRKIRRVHVRNFFIEFFNVLSSFSAYLEDNDQPEYEQQKNFDFFSMKTKRHCFTNYCTCVTKNRYLSFINKKLKCAN
jgi:hypothetical protein